MKKNIFVILAIFAVVGLLWTADCAFAQGMWFGPYYAENTGGTAIVRTPNGNVVTVLRDPRLPIPYAQPIPQPVYGRAIDDRRPLMNRVAPTPPRVHRPPVQRVPPTQVARPPVQIVRPPIAKPTAQAVMPPASKPLPALPVPPVMTGRGVVQALTPRPLPDFPVAKSQPVVKPQPALQVPPTKTEKGVAQAPNPRPTPDFPVAKPQQQTPVAEIKRTKGFLDGKAVVVNQENIHVNVMLSAANNLGRKVAIEVKPGEYVLLRGTVNGWEPEEKKPVKEVPRGYEIVKGQEVKS